MAELGTPYGTAFTQGFFVVGDGQGSGGGIGLLSSTPVVTVAATTPTTEEGSCGILLVGRGEEGSAVDLTRVVLNALPGNEFGELLIPWGERSIDNLVAI